MLKYYLLISYFFLVLLILIYIINNSYKCSTKVSFFKKSVKYTVPIAPKVLSQKHNNKPYNVAL
jgi:hypothetical protein